MSDPRIAYLADQRAFLLAGDGFGYAFAIDPDPDSGHGLRHLHWGAPITADDLAVLAADRPLAFASSTVSRPRAHAEELVVHGGQRFEESALKVEFADGVRGLELEYTDHAIESGSQAGADGDTLAVRLVDRRYALAVTLHYRIRPDGGALERWAELTNSGDTPVVLDRAYSASWGLPARPRWNATWLAGAYAAETHVTRRELGLGKHVIESRRGIPGHGAQPWVALDSGAGDTHGEVWSVALAWSGSWRLATELAVDGPAHLTAGVNDYDLRQPLAPHSSRVLPVTVGVYSGAGHDELTDRWHAYERAHVVPRADTIRPVLYNSWEATFFDVSFDAQVELARRASRVGAELFVIDDGWFAGRDDEESSAGDWTPDVHKFPHGLAPLADEIHRLGMRFGVWVEPEVVSPDSDLYRAHPDWIYHWPTRERTLGRKTHMLALSRQDVRDHLVKTLDALLSSAEIDALKWDLNRPVTEAADGTGDSVWLAHVDGLYEVIDRIREAHPDVWIESCSSGGGRTDLGIMSRTEWVWPSDNTDAYERLPIQQGYTYVHSPHTMMCWVTDSPTYLGKREIPLRFRFHSAMCGLLSLGGNLAEWSESELAEAQEYVAQYKAVRHTIQFGRLRRLSASGDPDLTALSYQSPDGAQVVVLALARSVRGLRGETFVRLRDVDAGATYRHAATGTRYSGSLLTSYGLPLPLAGDYASELAVLERVTD